MKSQLALNIYGYSVLIESDLYACENLKASIDFEHFRENQSNSTKHLKISLHDLKNHQTTGFFIGRTKMCRVRQKSFSHRELEYIQNGKTLAIVNDDTSGKIRNLSVKAVNLDVIDDILYFFLNSSAGEYLEYNGIMRLHALSYKVGNQTALVHGAPGYGKSTLALALIKNPQIKIFSDEITIFNLTTKLLQPYPMRIASVENLSSETGSQNIKFTYFFNKKSLVPIEKSKISSPAALNSLYQLLSLGKKSSCKTKCTLIQKIKLSFEILLGTGLIQMWEYLLRLNNLHIICGILFNRLKLVCYIWNIKAYAINRSCSLNDKVTSLLQT